PQELRVELLGLDDAAQVEEGARALEVEREHRLVVAVETEGEQSFLLRVVEYAVARVSLLHVAELLEKAPDLGKRDRPHRRQVSPHETGCRCGRGNGWSVARGAE